jgi:thiol-disulfide isomerase/thioredoxin
MKFIGIIVIILLVGGILGILIVNNLKSTTQNVIANRQVTTSGSENTQGIFNANKPAPELMGITAWLNPDKPFTLKSLRGKVVLVDFWTNQCINCIHTLPYVTKWYDTYKDQGFVVVGVHTPELAYEHTIASIQAAIQTYGIHYPVAQDNNYATWNAYNNQYWPAEYLIDKKGIIRRTFFGEGEYDKTELAIQTLLKE